VLLSKLQNLTCRWYGTVDAASLLCPSKSVPSDAGLAAFPVGTFRFATDLAFSELYDVKHTEAQKKDLA